MEKKNAKVLLEKYNAGLCTEEEKAIVENWYVTLPDKGITPGHERLILIKEEIWRSLPVGRYRARRLKYFSYVSTAAILTICIGTGIYFSPVFKRPVTTKINYVKHDVAPGGNKATLTLADGRKIILDNKGKGEIAEQSGVKIRKTSDGQLVYTISGSVAVNPDTYNSIVTPRGGQYQIILPDGTRVWLNASSSLKFPAAFTGKERKVELSGEAYFEVAKNPVRPFKVITDKEEVEVLGTHFNINSYSNESTTRTALFEGSVKVTSNSSRISKMLKPGQQSLIHENMLEVAGVDADEALAWKNGLFIFNNETLESIMRKVSRWYDVDVVYKSEEVRQDVFGGSVSRFGNVSEVLRMLEITGNVRFGIEENRIIVMKK
ncbi:MAG TPA: FecR domain-containing protein [Pedobacter sp.]